MISKGPQNIIGFPSPWVRNIAFIILTILCLGSCRKQSGETCESLPDPGGFGWQNETPKMLRFVCYNPLDDQEFLFVHMAAGTSKLYTYNTSSNILKLVFEGGIWYPPRWGKNGWILLNLSDENIWKVKSNGDSLTKITSAGHYHYSNWTYDCDAIITDPLTKVSLLNLNGALIDSFENLSIFTYGQYFDRNSIISNGPAMGGGMVGIYYLSERKQVDLAPTNFGTCQLGPPVSNNEFVWCDKDGIYRTNRETKSTVKLKSACGTKQYATPTVNSTKTKMMFIQIAKIPEGTVLHSTYRIMEMNIDGSGEREIPVEL
jgi:hypothetical protein